MHALLSEEEATWSLLDSVFGGMIIDCITQSLIRELRGLKEKDREEWLEAVPTFEDLVMVHLDVHPDAVGYKINATRVIEALGDVLTVELSRPRYRSNLRGVIRTMLTASIKEFNNIELKSLILGLV